MPIEIKLPQSYQLHTEKDNPILELPSIELAPLGSNLPHLSSIVYSVTGTHPELAAPIESVYREFSSSIPIKIFSLQRLKRADCKLTQLPAAAKLTLKVRVGYFDSDAEGNPNLAIPKETISECNLWSSPSNTPFEEAVKSIKNEQIPNYPGWLAIDFGTSSSTVTLYDPKKFSQDDPPQEQGQRLGDRFRQWLSKPLADALPGVSMSEWEGFITEVSAQFDVDPSRVDEILPQQQDMPRLLKLIRQIELSVGTRSEVFRRAVSKQLNQIYHEAFRVPPLTFQGLIPVELDLIRHLPEVASELEILSLEPLNVLMGERSKQDRNNAIKTATSTNWDRVIGKFHHSPKRYLGQGRSLKVTLDGQQNDLSVSNLIQGALAHLIQLTEDYRQNNPNGLNFSVGAFNQAVVTYPAIAPPVVRRELEQLVRTLGIEKVETIYDEAVSVAIFFLWREFGGDLNIGIESFKSRCYQDGDKWVQNLLVLDIGGGTTDLALIQLTLQEEFPFKENEDPGKGGRYYILTPKLLGSSGNLQLGGELITLRVFLLLKAAIADCLLTAVSGGYLQSPTLENRIGALNPRFCDSNGKFQSGSILSCVDRETLEGDSAYTDALEATESVISTRWIKEPSRLGTFYTLWEYAEEAKIALGKKLQIEDNLPSLFVLPWEKISALFKSEVEFQVADIDSLSVTLNHQQFERAVMPVITEAIGIAKGLMESRLHQNQSSKGRVDWLILSGKTCNLHLVEREIYQEFSKSQYFVWNPERITFAPEYSKLATSVGACYAEKLRQLVYDPMGAKYELLSKGANQLYINVKNLSFDLPCSFFLSTQDRERITIFNSGEKLYQIDRQNPVVKARSGALPVSFSMFIYRQDFEGKAPQLWGKFDGQALVNQLGMDEFEFRKEIKVKFEIDNKLQFTLLLYRKTPHRAIAADVPSIDLKSALSNASEGELPAIISDDNRLIYDIAINVEESRTVHSLGAHTILFEAGKDYSNSIEVFRYGNGTTPQQKSGLISNPISYFPLNGKHSFYLRQPQSKEWMRIGELSRPGSETDYPCQYYVALDEEGILRLYAGEVPYWISHNPNCLQQEGSVFQTEPELQPQDDDKKRDPFSGLH